MTILHVMQCTNLGGMEQAAFRIMDGLCARGFRFRLATPRPFGPARDRVLAFDPEAVDFPYRGRFGWRDFPSLRRHLRGLAAECSHIWITGTCAASLAATGGFGKPRVLSHHYHHLENRFSPWKWRAFYGLLCRKIEAITYPTHTTRDEALAIAPWLAPRAHVSPDPVRVHYRDEADREQKRAAARRSLGLPAEALIVGNAGWLIRRKRFDVFLETAARIRQARPDALFLICGGGPLDADLKAQAARLGLDESVHFAGWVHDMAPYYQAFDVVLFNSDHDALGMTPLEAAGHGACMVASQRYGGLHEAIDHGINGYLHAEHDPAILARDVLKIAADPALAARLRGAARARLLADFSDEAACAFFESFFQGAGDRPANGVP